MRRAGALAAAIGLWAAAPVGAQRARAEQVAPPAWLGLSYDVEWVARGESCEARVVVESVVEGAPADRAGLRPGDALVALDGRPLRGGPLQLTAARLAVGDSVRLGVARDGRVREVLAIAGKRPDRPPLALRLRREDGLMSSDAPVVTVRADTLVGRNLDGWTARRGSGYWLATADGRVDYRRVDLRRVNRFSGSETDRRVANLVACVQRTQAAGPGPAPAPLPPMGVVAIQERADSIREVMTRRVLTRPAAAATGAGERPRVTSAPRVFVAPPPPTGAEAPPAPRPGAVSVYAFSVGDHLVAAERGVAGAELTALEPELAAYFRGVRDGLLVLRVSAGTPAARAGLQPGDVITAGAGRTLDAVADLRHLLTLPDPTPLELRVVRHGRTRTVTLHRD